MAGFSSLSMCSLLQAEAGRRNLDQAIGLLERGRGCGAPGTRAEVTMGGVSLIVTVQAQSLVETRS